MIKGDEGGKQEINTKTYLKKKKNRYHNMSEEKKQGIKEYQKNYCEAKKSQYNNE